MPPETVADVMHRGAVTCAPSTSLEEAVRLLSDSDVTSLIVIGNAGELLGVLSHMDILRHYGEELAERQVGEIMNPSVLTIEPDEPLRAAISAMLSSNAHRLIVVSPSVGGSVPLGMLSTSDIIRHVRGARWAWRWE